VRMPCVLNVSLRGGFPMYLIEFFSKYSSFS
jgi:hypothetical protein